MDSVAEIKSRLSIVEVVSQYVQLKKAGRNFKACCPFHSEKTPSFIISPERQFAWCYGCQTGGDIFKIVQLLEGVDFREALKILAEKAGVDLPMDFAGGNKKEKREKLIEINETTADFFTKELKNSSKVQKYLKLRGLKKEIIEKWRIGFAPDSFEKLSAELCEHDFSKKELIEAGVAGLREMAGGQIYDRFRNRVMFPITDHRGRVVAFTGRVLDSSEPKYLNSPESPVFTKGSILFGFVQARETIRIQKFAVIAEGQMDVITCHAAGFCNVVASSGTALTEMHLKALKNLIGDVIFCFDSDIAGVESTRRALEIAASVDISAKVAVLPAEFKDPDEAISSSPQIFADAVANARSPMNFFFEKVYAAENLADASIKKRVARELLLYAQKITSAIEREDFLRKLSIRLGVSELALTEELINLPQSNFVAREKSENVSPEKFSTEDMLLGLVLTSLVSATELAENLKKISFHDSNNAKIWQKLCKSGFTEIYEDTTDPENVERAEKLRLFVSDKYSEFSDIKVKEEILRFVEALQKKSYEVEKQKLKFQIDAAENSGDEKRAAKLLIEYQKLLKK